MKTQVYSVKMTLIALFALLILLLPLTIFAQTSENDLSADIDLLFEELRSLQDEIQTLRAEVRVLRSNSSNTVSTNISSPSPPTTTNRFNRILRTGDSGANVRELQEVLINLGFDIPAGVTGNFFSQTENVLSQLQIENGLPATGILDQATIDLLNALLDTQSNNTLPEINTSPVVQPEPTVLITPNLRIISPISGLSPNAGVEIPLKWSSTYAPSGAKISFSLVNKLTNVTRPIYETEDLTGTYNWTLPSNMPGDNEIIAELTYQENENSSSVVLVSQSRNISIFGGIAETTTSTETSTNTTSNGLDPSYAQYLAFYKGTEFVTCMAGFPETTSLIAGWLDDGLLRHQFPWNDITGAAADKVLECEGDEFANEDTFNDCISNTTESSCSAQTGCSWFDSFCGDEGYDPISGGGQCTGTTEDSCVSVENCHWYEDSVSSEPYSCFYPDAQINGESPGYTVWCEYDYQNCHEGSSSGAEVSLDGLSLGAPSSCESGFGTTGGSDSSYCYYDSGSTSSSSNESFVANVVSAFSQAISTILGIFGI